MTDVATTAEIVKFRKPAMTGAERQKLWRDRRRQKKFCALPAPDAVTPPAAVIKAPRPRPAAVIIDVTPVTRVTKRPFELSPWILRGASVALAAVGLSMNAVYARSLGSSDVSAWLFLALGVAADSAALVLPSVAAKAWKANERLAAVSAWAAFAVVFGFAIIGTIGFASTSISDVTTLRSSRITPAVTLAETSLRDATTSRDRECKGGVGKFCREREAAVASARQNLEQAMLGVSQSADPQAAALVHVVSWISHGALSPSEADVGMVRLILFALLPQLGGILLMAARRG